jgi:hypothetical protein
MSPETKLAMRRWTIRQLRKLWDFLDEQLHAAEVKLRNDLSDRHQVSELAASSAEKTDPSQDMLHRAPGRSETFLQWEARKSGVAPVSKKQRRQRGMPAAAFDLRFEHR